MKFMKKMLTLVVSVCLLAFTFVPASVDATDGNAAVKEACQGVVQVIVTYVDNDNHEWQIQSGSGFFIGSEEGADTILTNSHVVSLDESTREAAKEVFGRDILNDVQIKIVVDRDVTVSATIDELNSSDYDAAILKLEKPLSGMKILQFATEEPAKTQEVFALGFPEVAQVVKDKQFYTTDQVTITSGRISDVTEIGQTEHIQHECTLTAGNSGGPLVDENGNVVGLNRARSNEEDYYYSVNGSALTTLFDKMSIYYETAGQAAVSTEVEGEVVEATVNFSALEDAIDDAKDVNADDYTEESYGFLEAALEDAEDVASDSAATQGDVDGVVADLEDAMDSLEEKKGLPIIPIVAGAVVVVVIIVVVVVLSSKKKKPASQPARPVQPQQVPQQPQYIPPQAKPAQPVPPVQPAFVPDQGGSDETTVLNQGSDETTVLKANAVPKATLRRISNNDTAIINKAVYSLGKERSKVDFCVGGNSSISRVHARIVFENGAFYVEDNNATNFTFVNGNKVNSGQRVMLNNGDRIKLSDEEFEFKA